MWTGGTRDWTTSLATDRRFVLLPESNWFSLYKWQPLTQRLIPQGKHTLARLPLMYHLMPVVHTTHTIQTEEVVTLCSTVDRMCRSGGRIWYFWRIYVCHCWEILSILRNYIHIGLILHPIIYVQCQPSEPMHRQYIHHKYTKYVQCIINTYMLVDAVYFCTALWFCLHLVSFFRMLFLSIHMFILNLDYE